MIGYIKGKSAIHIARNFAGRSRNFVGQHFWARGYFVSTVGLDEQAIRADIRDQEREDRRLEQLGWIQSSQPEGCAHGLQGHCQVDVQRTGSVSDVSEMRF